MPLILMVLDTKRSYRPTKVIVVHGKIGHGTMHIPVFGKTVAFPNLAGIAISVRPIVPLDRCGINRVADRQRLNGSLYGFSRSEDRPHAHVAQQRLPGSSTSSGRRQNRQQAHPRRPASHLYPCRVKCDFIRSPQPRSTPRSRNRPKSSLQIGYVSSEYINLPLSKSKYKPNHQSKLLGLVVG